MASAEYVAVQVRHGFAAVRAVVDDEPVAAFFQADDIRDLGGLEQQMAEQFPVAGGCLSHARDHFFGDDQNVRWRLGIDVVEGEHGIVFIDNRRRESPGR